MILRYFHLPFILLVLLLFLHFKSALFLLQSLYMHYLLIYYYSANLLLFLFSFLTVHSHLYLNPSDHRGHLAIQTDSKTFVTLFNQSLNAQFYMLSYTN